MIDATSQAILQSLLRREGRGLLRYVSESFPWTTPEERAALDQLQAISREEVEGTASVARFLARHRVMSGPLGPYPMSFTNINYVALDHLLPMLVEFQRQRVSELEADLGRVTDPDCRQQLQPFLELKRRHHQLLEQMARKSCQHSAVKV